MFLLSVFMETFIAFTKSFTWCVYFFTT